ALLLPAIVLRRVRKDLLLVFTFHTEPPRGMSRLKVAGIRRLLASCDAVTCSSEFLVRRIREAAELPSNFRIRVIYPGATILPSPNSEKAKIERLTSKRGPILSYVGAMAWT